MDVQVLGGGPTQPGETGWPSPSNTVGYIPPLFNNLKPASPNSSLHTTAPVVPGDEEGWAGHRPSVQGHTTHPAQPQRGFYCGLLPIRNL